MTIEERMDRMEKLMHAYIVTHGEGLRIVSLKDYSKMHVLLTEFEWEMRSANKPEAPCKTTDTNRQ